MSLPNAIRIIDPEQGPITLRAGQPDPALAVRGAAAPTPYFVPGSERPRVLTWQQRAGSPADLAQQPVNALYTALMQGKHRSTSAWLREIFIPTTPTDQTGAPVPDGLSFSYPVWGTGHMSRVDTRKPEGGPYPLVTQTVTWVSDVLELHGVAVVLTDEEVRRAYAGLDWVDRMLQVPADVLDMSLQYATVDLLDTTVANTTYFTGHQVALGGGAEWDNGGDALGSLRTGINLVQSKSGMPTSAIHVGMSQKSWNALLEDPLVQAEAQRWGQAGFQLTAGAANQDPRTEAVRKLLGVGSLTVFHPVGLSAAGVYGPILADNAYIWTNGDAPASDYNSAYGKERFAALFEFGGELGGGPTAREPWRDGRIGATLYAVEHIRKPAIVNNTLAYQIRNTSSA